jgi:hypothetical protein
MRNAAIYERGGEEEEKSAKAMFGPSRWPFTEPFTEYIVAFSATRDVQQHT